MKRVLALCALLLLTAACSREDAAQTRRHADWRTRTVPLDMDSPLESGSTYLSVYAQVYSRLDDATTSLTATVSIRNVCRADTVFLESVEYFDTRGDLVTRYIERPVFVLPMETLEIVIPDADGRGGSGGNFLFDWSVRPGAAEPRFEAVMISTSGQQGLSFATQGVRVL